jgi:D-tyrosyl-tRNA(Tyr) deacylase
MQTGLSLSLSVCCPFRRGRADGDVAFDRGDGSGRAGGRGLQMALVPPHISAASSSVHRWGGGFLAEWLARAFTAEMRAVVQRVSEASVTVDGEVVGAIGVGFLVLVCAMDGDGDSDVAWMRAKLPALRIFPNEAGRFDRSLTDVGGAILLVSQFTLSAELAPGRSKGNRPAFTGAEAPAAAAARVDALAAALREDGVVVETGRFGAHMEVALVNSGPVTLWLESRPGTAAGQGQPS